MAEQKFLDFIDAVRKQPMVYDTMDEKYRDKEAKCVFWNQMAKDHGFAGATPRSRLFTHQLFSDGKKASGKWDYFRDKYKKDKKSMKLPSGSAASGKTKWPYFEALAFLDQFNLERERFVLGSEHFSYVPLFSAASTINPSQVLFPDQEEISGETTEDTNDDDSDRFSSFSSTPGSKRKGKPVTPLEKRFMASMATQEKVMEALATPTSAEEQFGQ